MDFLCRHQLALRKTSTSNPYSPLRVSPFSQTVSAQHWNSRKVQSAKSIHLKSHGKHSTSCRTEKGYHFKLQSGCMWRIHLCVKDFKDTNVCLRDEIFHIFNSAGCSGIWETQRALPAPSQWKGVIMGNVLWTCWRLNQGKSPQPHPLFRRHPQSLLRLHKDP